MAINKAVVMGFLGADPKINTTESGVRVAKFSVATTEKAYTNTKGKNVPDRTEWHNIVIWGKLAEVAERYLRKGSKYMLREKCVQGPGTTKTGQSDISPRFMLMTYKCYPAKRI